MHYPPSAHFRQLLIFMVHIIHVTHPAARRSLVPAAGPSGAVAARRLRAAHAPVPGRRPARRRCVHPLAARRPSAAPLGRYQQGVPPGGGAGVTRDGVRWARQQAPRCPGQSRSAAAVVRTCSGAGVMQLHVDAAACPTIDPAFRSTGQVTSVAGSSYHVSQRTESMPSSAGRLHEITNLSPWTHILASHVKTIVFTRYFISFADSGCGFRTPDARCGISFSFGDICTTRCSQFFLLYQQLYCGLS